MQKFATGFILVAALLAPAYAQKSSNPLVGRWDFNIPSRDGNRAAWLGITPVGCPATGVAIESQAPPGRLAARRASIPASAYPKYMMIGLPVESSAIEVAAPTTGLRTISEDHAV